LIEKKWSDDDNWVAWAKRVSDEADKTGLRSLVFPGVVPEQAVRWDLWSDVNDEVKLRRLFTALSYELCS
jgi:hypothetical protein